MLVTLVEDTRRKPDRINFLLRIYSKKKNDFGGQVSLFRKSEGGETWKGQVNILCKR